MKKLFTFFFALAASAGTIFAKKVKIDDLYYNLDASNQTAEVTYQNNSENDNYSGLTSVGIPSSVIYEATTYSVTSIGGDAFYNCRSLTSVAIPSSVMSIKSAAFFECTGLQEIHISDIATWCACTFGEYGNPLLYAQHLFLNDFEIKNLVIPDDVTTINACAFQGFTGLTSVIIPGSVTCIGYWAFYRCTGLTSIEIPNSVTSIGNAAFSGCTGLTSIVAPTSIFDINESDWTSYTHSLESVTFNGGELTYNVLGVLSRSYKTLTSLDISAVSNAELDDEAFKGFYNLHTLVLPAGLTKIGYMAVAECKNLQSIDIPVSVTEISQSAFENCRSLKTITFGGQASSVPGRFNAPSSASQLQIIGNWAFYNCHELQNLTIPEGVTYIGDGAFYGCVYMEDLSLPASVQTIGDNTFALCAKLQKIVVNAPVPPSIQAKTFFDVKRQIPVYVPDESVNAYKNDAQWGEFNIQGASQMPQAIENNYIDYKYTKILRNGQILILRGAKTYTITGQEIK